MGRRPSKLKQFTIRPWVRAYSDNNASINGRWDPSYHSDIFLMDLYDEHQLIIFGVHFHTYQVFPCISTHDDDMGTLADLDGGFHIH